MMNPNVCTFARLEVGEWGNIKLMIQNASGKNFGKTNQVLVVIPIIRCTIQGRWTNTVVHLTVHAIVDASVANTYRQGTASCNLHVMLVEFKLSCDPTWTPLVKPWDSRNQGCQQSLLDQTQQLITVICSNKNLFFVRILFSHDYPENNICSPTAIALIICNITRIPLRSASDQGVPFGLEIHLGQLLCLSYYPLVIQ